MIRTNRLTLVPGTVALVQAEIHDRESFAQQLGATVPDHWPPATLVDALPLFLGWMESAAPGSDGWYVWYALTHADSTSPPVLIGGGGFLGPPDAGSVQMGYSVLDQFQRQGYATEIVRALSDWAFSHDVVKRIAAETEWANPASVRVLEKTGFVLAGEATEQGGASFELLRQRQIGNYQK